MGEELPISAGREEIVKQEEIHCHAGPGLQVEGRLATSGEGGSEQRAEDKLHLLRRRREAKHGELVHEETEAAGGYLLRRQGRRPEETSEGDISAKHQREGDFDISEQVAAVKTLV